MQKRLEFGDLSRGLQPRPFMFKGLQAKKQKRLILYNVQLTKHYAT